MAIFTEKVFNTSFHSFDLKNTLQDKIVVNVVYIYLLPIQCQLCIVPKNNYFSLLYYSLTYLISVIEMC